jgi:hypothetical protein
MGGLWDPEGRRGPTGADSSIRTGPHHGWRIPPGIRSGTRRAPIRADWRILRIRVWDPEGARMGGLADPSDQGLGPGGRPYGRTLPKDPSYDRTASLRYLATYLAA